ncbi:MAG: 16S rRNA (cytidine(1402)-2'-O)-methyltransferase [Bifidobacteriaceae bacterium]|jgi:16S rRNA (cytidine1402-2'-O)-methyltransferase|nr:16S rRNA (cytidine(1402)-2'-O)-methyltransferase [Bifidobacteriaceae bacterium]
MGTEQTASSGIVVVAASPIGNDADATGRLTALLGAADVVAAEDTRRARALAARLGVRIAGKVMALHDFNERDRSAGIVEAAAAGATVVLVSDAGTPVISDPGFRLVRGAIAAGVRVTAAPGASAALAALAVSGLPTDRFCFEGFLPRGAGERAALLEELAGERRTLVFFESPRRTAAALGALAEAFGAGRPAAVCRELTKTHEEIVRGPLGELAQWADGREVLGEVTLVVGGAPEGGWDVAALAAEVAALADAGARLAEAAADVAKRTGAPRRELYAAALGLRGRE